MTSSATKQDQRVETVKVFSYDAATGPTRLPYHAMRRSRSSRPPRKLARREADHERIGTALRFQLEALGN